MQSVNVHVTPRTQTRQGRKTCSPQTGAGAPTPGPREPTFRDWSIVMKDGIMDVRSVYLSCHSRSVFTVGSDATKNCK